MIILADEGDDSRRDKSCGILYGVLRDSAYKLKNLAEKEKQNHIQNDIWDIEESANHSKKIFDDFTL